MHLTSLLIAANGGFPPVHHLPVIRQCCGIALDKEVGVKPNQSGMPGIEMNRH